MDSVGTVTDYGQLRAVIAARRKELGLSQLEVDELAGVQTGYTGKIECGARHFGDVSFGSILGALGIKIEVVRAAGTHGVSDDEAKASIERLRAKRKKLAGMGGKARAEKTTVEQRRASARKAALSRWRDWRAVKAEHERKAKRKAK